MINSSFVVLYAHGIFMLHSVYFHPLVMRGRISCIRFVKYITEHM